MKINYTRLVRNFIPMLMLALGFGVANADTKLFIEDFTISNSQTYNMPVMLTNEEGAVGCLNFDIVLPAELEIVGTPYVNNERVNVSYQTLNYNPRNHRVMINSQSSSYYIAGTEGPVVYVPVQLAPFAMNNAEYTVKLTECVVGTPRGAQLWSGECEATCKVVPGVLTGVSENEEMLVNPSEEFILPFSFTNTCSIYGVQALLTLPEGFTVEESGEPTARMAGYSVQVNARGEGKFGIIAYSMGLLPVSGSEGVAFNLKVTAPADFAGEGVAEFSDIQASYDEVGHYLNGTGFSVKLVSGGDAYTTATNAIDVLQAALDAAVAEIAGDENIDPSVKEAYDGASIQAQIDALKQAVDEAYANHTLKESYDDVMAPAEGIQTEIDGYVAAARHASDVLQAGVNADKVVSDLQAALNAAVETIQNNPELSDAVKEAYNGSEIQAEIDALKQAIDAAKADGTIFDNYDNVVAPAAGIQAEIDAYVAAAEKAEQDAKESAAYAAAVGEIAQMKADLEAAKQEVAEGNPQADVEAEFAAAEQLINDAETALNNAWSETETNGTPFVSPVTDEAKQAVADAIAAAKAEAVRQQANYDAYQAALAEIEQLKADVEAAKQEIQQTYPASDVQAMFDAMDQQVAALETAAGEAYTAVAESGDFVSPVTDEAKQAVADAIAAAKAEAARQAAALAAYNQTLTEINELQTLLNQTKINCNGLYPEADVEDEIQAAQDAIDQAKADALAAKDASMAGEEYSYVVPTNEIHALISAILTEAKRQETNKTAYDNTLAQIALLEQKYEAMAAEVAEKHPEVDCTEVKATALAAIDQAKQDAAAAYEAVAEEGQYSYVLNVSAIEALIEEIGRYAELNGIESIYADQFGKDAKMYNLMGMPVKNPAPGTIVIVIDSNGQAHKLQVK